MMHSAGGVLGAGGEMISVRILLVASCYGLTEYGSMRRLRSAPSWLVEYKQMRIANLRTRDSFTAHEFKGKLSMVHAKGIVTSRWYINLTIESSSHVQSLFTRPQFIWYVCVRKGPLSINTTGPPALRIVLHKTVPG